MADGSRSGLGVRAVEPSQALAVSGDIAAAHSTFRLDQLKIEGRSRAGDATWFRVDPPGLALDVGRGAGALAGCRHLFLSHAHLDHSLGLPFVLSQRALYGLGKARVFCPKPVVETLDRFLDVAAEMEGRRYDYELRGLEPGETVAVGRDLEVEAFAVRHSVPTLGYHLVQTVSHLDPAFRERSPEELATLRAEGLDITKSRRELWLSYCADTGPEVFDLEPRVFEARVLLIECTFLAPDARQKAATYGHLHLEDLVERRERFQNEAVVLHHLSRKHTVDELRRRVAESLDDLAKRVHVLVSGDE